MLRQALLFHRMPIAQYARPALIAILDRFLHHADVVKLTGKSYRMHERAQRNADTQKETAKA